LYTKQCRSILELAVHACHGAITFVERQDIERVQKVALHIILGEHYESYSNALILTNLKTIEARRDKLCIKFVKKAEKHEKHRMWFKPKSKVKTV
jgi:hypothetical protein